MRIAVISDIHGNRLALEAVMDDIARHHVDATLNLGDVVSGPIDPAGTVDILQEAEVLTIRGNHDRWVLEDEPESPVDRFAFSRLGHEHVELLRSLPGTFALGQDVFMCHGTPSSDTDPWLDNWWEGREARFPDEAEVAAKASGYDFPVLLCGHTHLSRAVRLRDGRMIVNPGSVGLQFNHGSPDARYALVEQRRGAWVASFEVVPYDHEAAARQAAANGFPHWREALTTGWAAPAGLF